MSTQGETTAKKSAGSPMGFFERYLTVWVLLCIGIGIALGQGNPIFSRMAMRSIAFGFLMALAAGAVVGFVSRPITGALLTFAVLTVLVPVVSRLRRRLRNDTDVL